MKDGTFGIVILGIMNIVIAIGGLCIWRFILPYDTVLAIISILLALTTYFGFMAISQSLDKGLASNIGSMRTAIAAGVLVLYFFILTISIFLTRSTPLSEFGQTMITNFTTIMGIIIPFYFGASAYVQAHARGESEVDD